MSQDAWGNTEAERSSVEQQNQIAESSNTAAGKKGRTDPSDVLNRWASSVLKEQRSTRRWGIFFKSLTFLYLFALLGVYLFNQSFSSDALNAEPHVAVVEIRGVIAADAESNADAMVGSLRRAFQSESSVAVIVRINSPGGSPVQASYIYDEIKRLRTLNPDKPVYSVITDIGASGGYYVAAAADEIYANPSSLVGSIGVISSGFGFVGLMEKLGIERRALTAGDSKALMDPFQPLGEEQKVFWQTVLETTHQQFISKVKEGRGDRLADDPSIFSGLVWSGEQAVELGLIDGLASTSQIARDQIGIEKLQDYTARPSRLDQLTERLGIGIATAFYRQFELAVLESGRGLPLQ